MAVRRAQDARRCGGAAMNCPDPETLSCYQAGTLPAEEAEAVREHLTGCPSCAALAAVPPAPDTHPGPEPPEPALADAAAPVGEAAFAASPGPVLTGTIVPTLECPSREELR